MIYKDWIYLREPSPKSYTPRAKCPVNLTPHSPGPGSWYHRWTSSNCRGVRADRHGKVETVQLVLFDELVMDTKSCDEFPDESLLIFQTNQTWYTCHFSEFENSEPNIYITSVLCTLKGMRNLGYIHIWQVFGLRLFPKKGRQLFNRMGSNWRGKTMGKYPVDENEGNEIRKLIVVK